MLTKKDVEILTAVQRRVPNAPMGAVAELQNISRSLHRLDEAYCNRELTTREERRKARLIELAQKLATSLMIGAVAYHQPDPRGCAIWIVFPADNRRGDSVDAIYPNGVAIY